MENIIQQIAEKLIHKILERAYSGGISDIDALSSDVLGDCREAAIGIVEAITAGLNQQIRDDKERRKAEGLVLKERERERSLLTELGRLDIPRDYYYDRENDQYVYLLDHVIGVQSYERISDGVSAKLVSLATEVSYENSAQIVTDGEVSRQSVRNSILRLGGIEKRPEEGAAKRKVRELHVFADEDHVHMQKECKEKGKKIRAVPLVTVTEGVEKESKGRNRTKEAMHFVDEKFNTKELWKSVEGYIGSTYDTDVLEKKLKEAGRRFPNRNLKNRIKEAMEADDRKKLDRILQSLYDACKSEKDNEFVSEFGKYLFGNYKAIRNRLIYGEVGSCTEGQVSHVLSKRFSRNPMGWSEEGLGKLRKQRVYVKNRGKIEADDFKRSDVEKSRYGGYAERIIKEACEGALDFSIFEKGIPIFDGNSGTQNMLRKFGLERGISLS